MSEALEKSSFGKDMDETIDTILPMMVMLVFVMFLLPSLPLVQSAQQYLNSMTYTGLTDVKVLSASPTLRWLNFLHYPPYVGLIGISIHNDGPDPILIGVNTPDELHELAPGEDYEVSMSGGQRRIEFVFYRTDTGEKASARLVGKY